MLRSPTLACGPVLWTQTGTKVVGLAFAFAVDASPLVASKVTLKSIEALAATTNNLRRAISRRESSFLIVTTSTQWLL
jgi:hypothetical protein